MRRRELIALTAFALFSARIQLSPNSSLARSLASGIWERWSTQMVLDAFRHGLRDLGWVGGENPLSNTGEACEGTSGALPISRRASGAWMFRSLNSARPRPQP